MKSTIVSIQQGSQAWHQHRASHLNASDCSAVLGLSSYKTRSQLLHEKATGLTAEIDAHTQSRFDKGHEFEAIARPWAEEIIRSELYPVVLAGDLDGLKLSASLDGLTMTEDISWEHKTGRADLLESLERGIIPEEYHPQMEMGLMLSGAEKCLFMASSGNRASMRHAWYLPNLELRAKIIAAWHQFSKDLATFVPEVTEAKPVGRTPETLPALRIEVTGMVTASNLAEYKAHALAVFDSINRELVTDAQFADAEKAIKWCGDVEDRLTAARQHALSQTKSLDELFNTMDDISSEARRVRLELDKLVKARKEAIRLEIVTDGAKALATHLESLNARLGKPYMPAVPADFSAAIKNKRTIESLKDAVNTTLAKAKIEANAIADKIHVNLRAISEQREHQFLFSDVASLVLKDPEFVEMAIKNRVAEHHAIEAARIETERQRIATEERAKAEADIAEAKRASEEAIAKAAQPAPIAVQPRQPMQPVQIVEQAQVTQPEDTGATMRLGQICERLGFTVTAEFLFSLGFEPSAIEKNAKLYKARLFPLICRALVQHIQSVAEIEMRSA